MKVSEGKWHFLSSVHKLYLYHDEASLALWTTVPHAILTNVCLLSHQKITCKRNVTFSTVTEYALGMLMQCQEEQWLYFILLL